ncbi:MAG: hypothetical protein ABL997_09240 [Planctomycetota bacterium]
MNTPTDDSPRELRNQLLTLLVWAAYPFVLVILTLVLGRDTAVDWQRLLPVLLPVTGGFVVAAAMLMFVLRLLETSAGRIAWTVGLSFASPMVAAATGVVLYMALSVLSFGTLGGDFGLFALVSLMPMLILQAPLAYCGSAVLLSLATGVLLHVARETEDRERTTRRSEG